MAAGGTVQPPSPALPRHLCADLLPEPCRASTAFPHLPRDSMMVSGIVSLAPSSGSLGSKPVSVLCSVCHPAAAFTRGQVRACRLPRAGTVPFPAGIPGRSQTLRSHRQHAEEEPSAVPWPAPAQLCCIRLAQEGHGCTPALGERCWDVRASTRLPGEPPEQSAPCAALGMSKGQV